MRYHFNNSSSKVETRKYSVREPFLGITFEISSQLTHHQYHAIPNNIENLTTKFDQQKLFAQKMSDQVIELKQLILPSIVSVAATYQLGIFALGVGKARAKFKVPPPATDGDEGFVRVFRAQQNGLEFAPLFFPNVWVSSIFFHPVPSAIVSFGYMYARHQYYHAYSRSADERLVPFIRVVKCYQILILMSTLGLFSSAIRAYAGYDIPARIMEFFSQLRS